MGFAVPFRGGRAQFNSAAHMPPYETADDHGRGDAGARSKGAQNRSAGGSSQLRTAGAVHAQQVPLEVVKLSGWYLADMSRRRPI